MAYINTKTGEYPVSFEQLKALHKNTSFAANPPDSFGDYVLVSDGPVPSFNSNQYIEQEAPVAIEGGGYQRNWVVKDYTSEEILAREQNEINRLARVYRKRRDDLLAETDWWASVDLTMSAEKVAYRQALRDITNHSTWPHLSEDDWPIKP